MRDEVTPIEPMRRFNLDRSRSRRHAHPHGASANRRWPTLLLCTLAWALGCAPRTRPAPVTPSSGGQTAKTAHAAARPYLIVVSLDAFRFDYLDRYQPSALKRLAVDGIRAAALIPPFPSKTFPSHYTIATGLYPGHHGILGNNFYDPRRDRWFRMRDTSAARDGSWYGGEPIWAVAEREGVKSAVYFWPGSEAQVLGRRPTYYKTFRASAPDSQRVDESIAWLRLPPAERPHFVMMYVNTGDDTTHRFGPETPRTASVVASLNRTVQRLLDGVASLPMRDSVNVVVLSDHGMADIHQDRSIPIRSLLAADGLDTTLVRTGDNGPSMSLWFDGDDALRDRTHAALRKRLVNARVYARGETPPHWKLDGNERAGDLIVVADLGYVITTSAKDRVTDRGSHGWDPTHEQMHGIFIAAGPQVSRAGVVPAFENVHVFPFLASLLGLAAPSEDRQRPARARAVRSRHAISLTTSPRLDAVCSLLDRCRRRTDST